MRVQGSYGWGVYCSNIDVNAFFVLAWVHIGGLMDN